MIRLRVKEVIEQKGLSMAKVSRKADLAYKTILDVCKDPYHDINISTLSRLQEALECSVHDFVEDVSEKPS